MKKALLLSLFVLFASQVYSQIKIGSGSKVGLTLSTFLGTKNEVKFKSDFDAAFEVFAKLDDVYSIGLEWDNCSYGPKTGSGDVRKRLNLYNTSLRLNLSYSIIKNLQVSVGGQLTLNYLGTTVSINGITRTVQGEDDFRDFDYGPVLELRYKFAGNFFTYLNYYQGLNDISFENPDIRQIAYQFGIGAYFGKTHR